MVLTGRKGSKKTGRQGGKDDGSPCLSSVKSRRALSADRPGGGSDHDRAKERAAGGGRQASIYQSFFLLFLSERGGCNPGGDPAGGSSRV